MEIVILNLSTQSLNQSEARLSLIDQLSEIVHKPPLHSIPSQPPINFDLQLVKPPSKHSPNYRGRRRSPNPANLPQPYWRLTFPTIDFGRAFLDHIHSPNTVHGFGQRVAFLQATTRTGNNDIKLRVPHPDLIHQLKTSDFKSPADERAIEIELNNSLSKQSLALLEFGWLSDDGPDNDQSFCSEYARPFSPSPSDPSARYQATVAIDRASSQIIIKATYRGYPHQLIMIRSKSIKRIEADCPSVLISLDCPPMLCEAPYSDDSEIRQIIHDLLNRPVVMSRQSAFDQDMKRVLPFTSHLIRLTFVSGPHWTAFCRQRAGLKLPRVNHVRRAIQLDGFYTAANLDQLAQVTKTLDLAVSFQLDLLLYNNFLNPLDILKLASLVSNLDPHLAERALIRLVSNLTGDENDDSQPLLPARRADFVHLERPGQLQAQFKRALDQIMSHTRRTFDRRADLADMFKCRNVTITPTGLILSGPMIEQSNSILRLYNQTDNFIRVSIRDEDGSTHHHDREINGPAFLRQRYLPIFTSGLLVAGRKFEFLGYSSSALKDHQAWFVCPFMHGDILLTASGIRKRMGNFSNVNRIPARYMARIAQAFTTTRQAVTLKPLQLKLMPDVERNFSVFTDGVGTISPGLADQVERALLGTMSAKKRHMASNSSCYQIRLGGYKGMLSLDSTLDGDIVRLRPSMAKFDAPDSMTLDIASSFRRPLLAFLNRPLIKILEDLKIPSKVFLNLQAGTVTMIEESRMSLCQSAKLMERTGLGMGSRLPKILRRLAGLMGSDHTEAIGSGFLEDCLDLVVINCLRDLKYRARIPMDGSYTLVGVADEEQSLKEGEIYACVQERGHARKYLQGPICISRSPCIHPGDVQVVRAIGMPSKHSKLASLVNCVVFSVQGSRSLPSCLGGGDLDGDLYMLITDPEMIPLRTNLQEPAAYEPVPMRALPRPCTIQDGIEFFLDYISSDLVGTIANRHLQLADRAPTGSMDEACLKLAELHSWAVDYPKTGVPVSVQDLPKVDPQKPDFMCGEYVIRKASGNERYYESTRVLGQLFRAIPSERTEFFEAGPSNGRLPTSVPKPAERGGYVEGLDARRQMSGALGRALHAHGLDDFPDPLWLDEFRALLEAFSEEFLKICKQNTLSKSKGRGKQHLTEMEGFLGTILSASSDRRLKRDTIVQLEEQTSELFETLRIEIIGEVDEIYNDSDDDDHQAGNGYGGHGGGKEVIDLTGSDDGGNSAPPNKTLVSRALAGWSVAVAADPLTFGVHSFGLVCLQILCSEMRV